MRLALALSFLIGSLSAFSGEPGITKDEIVIGQSCAISGPAQELGLGTRAGLIACFSEINAKGGIKGRKIRLVTLDDGYEPERAVANTKRLIDKEKVFLLIGEVGTPTSKAVLPVIDDRNIPFFGPFTGAEFLRHNTNVVNVRSSYMQELDKLALYLVKNKRLSKIACFYQNDDYGLEGLRGIKQALHKYNLELTATASYERNTVAVRRAVLQLYKSKPEAVVMVGSYKPCSLFIKEAKAVGLTDTVFCNLSFVGIDALVRNLGPVGEGCIISQVVSHPEDESIPLVQEHNQAMKKYQPFITPGYLSLEGYLAGRFFCEAMERIPGEPTRKNLLETIKRVGTFRVGGVQLDFGPEDNQGMDDVYLTIISDGKIVPLTY